MGGLDQKEFQQRVGRVDSLVRSLERIASPDAQATAREMVQALLDLHGSALERLLDVIYESGPSGQALIDQLGDDEVVGSLLLLHGLHPLSLEARIDRALEKVRPYMRSHGGNVELLGITPEGVVKLRLQGSCDGCPSSRVTLKYAVEEAIFAAAPDVMRVEAESGEPAPAAIPLGFIPLTQVTGQAGNGNGWVAVDGLATLHDGSLRTLDVSGAAVLFCRVDGSLYAYANTCPNCGQLLGQARLAGKDLRCSQCGHNFDVMRAGRDLDEPRLYLAPFPLLQEAGQVKIALHGLQN